MSQSKKFWGSINLTTIKQAIESGVQPFKGKKGDYLDVTVWVNDEPDKFGNSLSIQFYNKETKEKFYAANLKLADNNGGAPASPAGGNDSSDGLPF